MFIPQPRSGRRRWVRPLLMGGGPQSFSLLLPFLSLVNSRSQASQIWPYHGTIYSTAPLLQPRMLNEKGTPQTMESSSSGSRSSHGSFSWSSPALGLKRVGGWIGLRWNPPASLLLEQHLMVRPVTTMSPRCYRTCNSESGGSRQEWFVSTDTCAVVGGISN